MGSVTQRERQTYTSDDPTSPFGEPTYSGAGAWSESEESGLFTGELMGPVHESRVERRRAERREQAGDRRSRRAVVVLPSALIVLVLIAAAVIYPKVRDHFTTADYSGNGTGTVSITVGSGDSAADIAQTLADKGVVKSTKAFVKAADADTSSQNIQAGTYNLHQHMSGAAALALLLDPASRAANGDLVVIEGANMVGVENRLLKALGHDKKAEIEKALKDVANSGVPLGYAPDGSANGIPKSVEGFLYPATYHISKDESPASIVQQMTGAFIAQDRATGFALDAAKAGLTPYQALIIASIAQSEAKFPEDMAKVARVIMNRLAAQRPLQIDATSVYGAEITGQDLKKVDFTTIDSPYNSYRHAGLPPTPISNPGVDALSAAVHPTAGNWTYYVNGDKDGHLFFTNSESAFNQAVAKCRANNWGCA